LVKWKILWLCSNARKTPILQFNSADTTNVSTFENIQSIEYYMFNRTSYGIDFMHLIK